MISLPLSHFIHRWFNLRSCDWEESEISYWEQRAKAYGARAVFDLRHPAEQLTDVTHRQCDEIFPHLSRCLLQKESLVLDFGCGPGRFTAKLAEFCGGRAIGVDPVQELLDMAPVAPNVEYMPMLPGKIPLPDEAVDLLWACLVLGAMTDAALEETLRELDRVLRKGGLLFLVENTTDQASVEHWVYRSVSEYCKLLSFVPLQHLHDYWELGERVSVTAGRKP